MTTNSDAELSAADNYHQRVESGYYVYGLLDPQAYYETGDKLLSIFYVGKGKSARWQQHEKDVLADLRAEEERLERRGSKAERIRKILERGEKVLALRLSAGYVDEEDAYYAEALAIDTVQAALTAAGRPPLTNATPGRRAGFVWLREHFVYTEALEQLLPSKPEAALQADDVPPAGLATEILVKGTADDLDRPAQRLAGPNSLPLSLESYAERLRVVEVLEETDGPQRRGWDPLDPWTDEEARERAFRYWTIAEDRVIRWLAGDEVVPKSLLLGVPTKQGQTVVRYAWEIEAAGTWTYYQNWKKWGVPLGRRLLEHTRLGHALYEQRRGKSVQVLYGYASGIRILPL